MVARLKKWATEGTTVTNMDTSSSSKNGREVSVLDDTIIVESDVGPLQITEEPGLDLKNVAMPKGFFDPPTTDPPTMEYLRKSLDKIKIKKFDGTSKTMMWSVWWKHFKARVHVCPENVLDDFEKLQFLTEALEGQPRQMLRVDKPGFFNDDYAYTTSIMRLHHMYGQKAMALGEVIDQIYALEPEGTSSQDYLAFIGELRGLVIGLIKSGSGSSAAHELGVS